jgi:transcriptional regulator with XRE-family HTH domain
MWYILDLKTNQYLRGSKMSTFGEKAKRLREEKNLSTRMLAEELEISSGHISKYENNVHEPKLSVLRKYAKFFNVTLDYLCDDTKE